MNAPQPLPHAPTSRQILATLRQQIIDQTFAPESRLPTRRDLAVQYHSNLVTVQRALDQLRRDGFVIPRGKRGTFVARSLPHLTRFAIGFGATNPGQNSPFYAALLNAVEQLPSSPDQRTLAVFEGLEPHQNPDQIRQFTSEAAARRLAGVILVVHPNFFAQTPVISPDLPRVCISSGYAANTPAVFPDYQSFFTRALDHLAARGRKRIAILSLTSGYETTLRVFIDELIAQGLPGRGMSTRAFWNLPLPLNPTTVNHVTQLLMRQTETPDGIIVADDNLLPAVTQGLLAGGHTTNEHLDVVGACNYPNPPQISTPVTLLGFDARQIIDTCLLYLNQQRAGQAVPELTLVPAVFEHEVPKR